MFAFSQAHLYHAQVDIFILDFLTSLGIEIVLACDVSGRILLVFFGFGWLDIDLSLIFVVHIISR